MEHFFGHDLPIQELQLRGLRIDPELRIGEASLMRSRWFDYRGMHPTLATYYYAHCYAEQSREFFTAYMDSDRPERARPFTPDDIFMSRDRTSMWLARRFADRLGIPYPFIVRFAGKRFYDRLHRAFPRPNQLYSEEFEADLLIAWQEHLRTRLVWAVEPEYQAAAWVGSQNQEEHLQHLKDVLMMRAAPRYRLIARLMGEGVLNRHLATVYFGEAEASNATAYLSELVSALDK